MESDALWHVGSTCMARCIVAVDSSALVLLEIVYLAIEGVSQKESMNDRRARAVFGVARERFIRAASMQGICKGVVSCLCALLSRGLALHYYRISGCLWSAGCAILVGANNDSRNDASDCQQDAEQTRVLEWFVTVDPTDDNDRASLEVPDDCAAHRPSFLDDEELGQIYQAG